MLILKILHYSCYCSNFAHLMPPPALMTFLSFSRDWPRNPLRYICNGNNYKAFSMLQNTEQDIFVKCRCTKQQTKSLFSRFKPPPHPRGMWCFNKLWKTLVGWGEYTSDLWLCYHHLNFRCHFLCKLDRILDKQTDGWSKYYIPQPF